MTTKAERIRQLLDAGMCNTMIAELVGTRKEYVRVVKQRLDPVRRKQDSAAVGAMQKTGDKRVAARAYAVHYWGLRDAGKSHKEAFRVAMRMRNYALRATGDRAAARAAYHNAKRGTANA